VQTKAPETPAGAPQIALAVSRRRADPFSLRPAGTVADRSCCVFGGEDLRGQRIPVFAAAAVLRIAEPDRYYSQ